MSTRTSLSDEQGRFLADTFGDAISLAPEVLRVYASDASLKTGTVLAVYRPRNAEELSRFMRWAQQENVTVHPRGRGTSLSGGCVPTVPGIVVSMLGMDRIIEISDTDFVAVVEPGVNTADLQAECAKKGLFYPPDPASSKATSVGGNVMTCAGGLRAVKYGVTRDYVLGVEAVLPGGDIVRFGGRCHKDVMGLDMARLFVGSEGTLGIVTKLCLKLLPLPELSASVLAGYASLDDAMQSMARVFRAGILPCAVEFMNETVLEVLTRTGEVPWPDTVRSLLLFQIDGSSDSVPHDMERLCRQLDDALWRIQGLGREEEARLWAIRRRISAGSYVLGPDRIGGDMAVPRGSLLAALRRFEEIAHANGKRLIGFGHAGDGNIHANLHYDASDPDDAARTQRTHRELDRAVLEFGGSLSGEHGAGCLKDVSLQIPPRERELMQAVRRVFDPTGILNPGKAY